MRRLIFRLSTLHISLSKQQFVKIKKQTTNVKYGTERVKEISNIFGPLKQHSGRHAGKLHTIPGTLMFPRSAYSDKGNPAGIRRLNNIASASKRDVMTFIPLRL